MMSIKSYYNWNKLFVFLAVALYWFWRVLIRSTKLWMNLLHIPVMRLQKLKTLNEKIHPARRTRPYSWRTSYKH